MTEHFDRGLANEELQAQLRDLLSLAVVGDHVRWVLVGREAAELAAWLAEAVPQWRALADQIARNLARLGVAPDGRVRSLAKDTPLHWVPEGWLRPDEARRLLAHRLGTIGEWACYRESQASDPDTAQLLNTVCARLQAQARWMSRSETSASRASPRTPPAAPPQIGSGAVVSAAASPAPASGRSRTRGERAGTAARSRARAGFR
jgi:starvation-inducible DNA-binding protein